MLFRSEMTILSCSQNEFESLRLNCWNGRVVKAIDLNSGLYLLLSECVGSNPASSVRLFLAGTEFNFFLQDSKPIIVYTDRKNRC